MQHLRWQHFLDAQDPAQVQPIRKSFVSVFLPLPLPLPLTPTPSLTICVSLCASRKQVMQIIRRSHYDAEAHSTHRTRSLIREISNVFARDAMVVYCRQQLDQQWANKAHRQQEVAPSAADDDNGT